MTMVPNDRKPVQSIVSEALVREAAIVLGDVWFAVERSLQREVEQEKIRRDPDFQRKLEAAIAFGTRFYDEHGVWGQEFSPLRWRKTMFTGRQAETGRRRRSSPLSKAIGLTTCPPVSLSRFWR